MKRDNFYILTGGPGSGKTAIIEALREKGFLTVGEVGRQIILEQVSSGGDAIHGKNQMKFRDLMLSRSLEDYRRFTEEKLPVFFDRGIPELVGYSHLIKAPVPKQLSDAVESFRYNRKVFIAPPWEEIYRQDWERKQTYKDAIDTYHACADSYVQSGYQLIEIPKAGVAERADFILGISAGAALPKRTGDAP